MFPRLRCNLMIFTRRVFGDAGFSDVAVGPMPPCARTRGVGWAFEAGEEGIRGCLRSGSDGEGCECEGRNGASHSALRMKSLFEELYVDVPVGGDHAVAAVVHVVVEAVGEDGLFRRGPCVGAEVLLAEKFVDGAGGNLCEELALGIRPEVCVAGLQEQRARCYESDKHVRVHGGFVGEATPLRVVRGELIGVARGRGEMRDGLAVVAMAECGAAFAGTACDDSGEALVVRAGPHDGFAEA